MGAKYAPTVANIFMSKWESEEIYGRNIPGLKIYKRYIDEIFLIWESNKDPLKEFLQYININKYNISFTANYSKQKVNWI